LGHEILFGSREPGQEKCQALVAEAGERATAATIAEAVAKAEAVALTIPWNAVEEVIHQGGDWTGKIIIDCTNPIAPGLRLAVGGDTSAAEQIAGWVKGANVVKAFNTTGWENMMDPIYNGEAITMFICGDDAAAKTAVRGLAESMGFEAADVGALETARFLEPMALAWISLAARQGWGRNMAFKIVRR
jgi:predicted dinucleotide-binding enzyme